MPPDLEAISIRRLRYFLAVADAGGFSRAAERLGVVQSHLSRQIIGLENYLKQRLFVRYARHVELTEAGEFLRVEVAAVIRRIDELPAKLRAAAHGTNGEICLGFTPSGAFSPLIIDVLHALVSRAPNLAFTFCVKDRSDLLEAVAERKIHAILAHSPVPPPVGLNMDRLGHEPILLVVPKGHRLDGRQSVNAAELAQDSFVFCERQGLPEFYDLLLSICFEAGFSPKIVLQVPQPICALPLVAANFGLTMLPQSMCEMHSDRVNFLRIDGVKANIDISLITRRNEHVTAVKMIRAAVREITSSKSGCGT